MSTNDPDSAIPLLTEVLDANARPEAAIPAAPLRAPLAPAVVPAVVPAVAPATRTNQAVQSDTPGPGPASNPAANADDSGIPVLTIPLQVPVATAPTARPLPASPVAAPVAVAPDAVAPVAAKQPAPALTVASAESTVDAMLARLTTDEMEQLQHKLSERILRQLQGRIDFVLEQRVRDSLADVLQLAMGGLTNDIKRGLQQTLEEVVGRAVAQEIARLQSGKK